MKPKSKILIIAGSDSSGGAGIQADIKTITSLGSYAMTAVTAVTVQNTTGVKSVIPISANEIKNQIIYTTKDIKPDAIKIGMLHSSQVVKKVIESLKKINVKRIILDPVMVAKGGTKLINNRAIQFLKKMLIKQVSLITPNILEAEVLTGIKIKNKEDMIFAANKLIKIEIDPERLRPIDADLQVPDTTKFKEHTGWEPEITVQEMCAEMIEEDLKVAKQNVLLKKNDY